MDKGQALSCCISVFIITFIVFLVSSIHSLQPNELGLDYSAISKIIDPTPYSAGTHFLGFGHYFIKFPKSVITVDFSLDKGADYPPLNSRTNDGLEVVLAISFQFIVDPTKLYDIYMQFNEQYKQVFELIAIDVLTSNTTEYSAYNFFVNRSLIASNMQDALNKRLSLDCFSQIEFFQLKNVDLPTKFEDSIQQSEVVKQSIMQAQATKNKTIIQLQTDVLTAQYQMNVTIFQNLAQGVANQSLQQGSAQANMTKITQNINARAYKNIMTQLKFSCPDQLIQYIKSKLIVQSKQQIMVSIQDPFISTTSCPSTSTTTSTTPGHIKEQRLKHMPLEFGKYNTNNDVNNENSNQEQNKIEKKQKVKKLADHQIGQKLAD